MNKGFYKIDILQPLENYSTCSLRGMLKSLVVLNLLNGKSLYNKRIKRLQTELQLRSKQYERFTDKSIQTIWFQC